jgi:hypothetical protein
MAALQDKGILGFKTGSLSLNKRPEIRTAHDTHDPLHLTRVSPDPSNREYIGLPKDWQHLLEGNGISKSDQEKAVIEIVKSYHGDVWDRMGHAPAPGSSRSPLIPGAAPAAYPLVSESVDDSFVPTVSTFFLIHHSHLLIVQNGWRYRLRKGSLFRQPASCISISPASIIISPPGCAIFTTPCAV